MMKLFKWKVYQTNIIILCLRYPLSYRNLQALD